MNVNKIVMGAMGIMIAVVMIGGALLPCVASALVISGDETTYYNNGSYFFKEVEDGDIFTMERVSVDDTITTILTTNGENIPRGASNTSIVVSDGILAKILTDGNNNYASVVSFTDSVYVPYYLGGLSKTEFSFNDGKITVTKTLDGTTTTVIENVPYTRGFIPCVQSDAAMITSMRADGRAFVNENSEIVLGYSDEEYGYYFRDGDYTKTNNDAYWRYNNDLSLVEGTTDIYRTNVILTKSVDGVEETVVPTPILVPYKIDGHKDSGATYTLIGAIPIIAVAGLVMAGAYVFMNRK